MTTHATTQDHDAAEAESNTSTDASISRLDGARAIVKRNVYWAVGAGLVPVPLADFAAITAVQAKMLKELSTHYKLRFFDDKAKKIIGALVASTGSLAVGGMVARSVIKLVPIVGQAIGFIGIPALAGALTQALGNVFVMHFESGGTLLNFDVETMRTHFQKELVTAKETIKHTPAEKKSAKHHTSP